MCHTARCVMARETVMMDLMNSSHVVSRALLVIRKLACKERKLQNAVVYSVNVIAGGLMCKCDSLGVQQFELGYYR